MTAFATPPVAAPFLLRCCRALAGPVLAGLIAHPAAAQEAAPPDTAPQDTAPQERIASHCIALARNAPPPLLRHAAFTLPGEDRVLLRYLNHASFAVVAEDGTVAVTDYTGHIGAADVAPDLVTMNNSHSTHWTAHPDPRIHHVLRGWPEPGQPNVDHRVDLGMMLVRNVPTDARGWGGEVRRDGNSIFIFEVAGLCIGHLGHLHQLPSAEQFAAIGRLDILMVPVDGSVTLGLEDMVAVVRRLRSKVVIPMHWFSRGSLEWFMQEMATDFDVVETGLNEMAFSIGTLPARPTVLVLEPAWLD
ncbi:MBL fold metallo-hydrolase [Pseudogemmobacter sonorensis]|uniref:MBL fold metallo-hydrolase n=1 Tax=Pseudogemmobacter sonorensis TaxID=2989681 RepID=UPI00368AB540